MSLDFKICKAKDCGQEFNSVFSKHRDYCSSECYKASKKSDLKLKSFKTPKKKCRICKESFEPKNNFIPVCDNVDCKTKYAMSVVEKQKKSQEAKERKSRADQKKQLKEKLKTLSDWHNDLQKEINTIVRLIDRFHPCISSQRPLGKSYDAGHLFGRQSNPHIRYHLFNIWAQSVHDNQWKSGNQLDFIDGIEKTFGTETKEYCLSLKGLPSIKLTVEEIQDYISKARQVVKHLKLEDKKYSIEERIELRKEYNLFIGIHK